MIVITGVKIPADHKRSDCCDKCHRPVSRDNSTTYFEALLTGNPFILLYNPRHLLPVIENGVVVCEGSPSRAQYLPGQERDTRPEFAYRPEYEQRYRQAYNQMQREIAAANASNN